MFEPKLFIRYRSKSLRNLTLVKAVPKFARSENFSYLAVGYLKINRCLFVTYYPIQKCNDPINQVVTSL